MEAWRTNELNVHGFMEDSWPCDQTQEGMSTKIPVHLTEPCVIKGGRWSTNIRAAHPVAQKAYAVAQPDGKTSHGTLNNTRKSGNIVKRAKSKVDDVRQPTSWPECDRTPRHAL